MLTQFGATADSLSKASALMFRIGTDANIYDDPDDVSIAPFLDSKFDSEKCEALKRLLALIAQGIDVSSYFPQVVKNVASQSLEVKKLVYLYLLHYAERRPNETLLSINYFQKDLGDLNPLVRAWALRTMAGIRLHVIAPLVIVAVGKCARDPSVYVRKCAATALPKLHDLRLEEHSSAIEEIVGILLKDNAPSVVGAAAAAFASICPNNLPLIGKNYRRLCETLPDVEEWGQILLVGILLRYVIAKHGLVEESIMLPSSRNLDTQCNEIADIVAKSYVEGPDKYLSQLSQVNRDSIESDGPRFTSVKSNDDVKIFLQCTSPLLWSFNSAVVLAAAGVHWIMSPREETSKIIKPLLFLLRSSSSSKYVVLCNIQVFAKAIPSLFAPYFEDFLISCLDSYQIKTLKLEILSSIATYSSISSIFLEFQDYIRDPDRKFAADTVAAIGLCAEKLPDIANTCLEGLMVLALSESSNMDAASFDEEEIVLVQAINSIKTIIKLDPPSHEKVIVHLVRRLDSISAPGARAMVIWMMGEYNNIGTHISKMIPAVFKYLAWRFTSEEVESKLQIVNTCIKVLLHAKEEEISSLTKTIDYVLELAKCDSNYDVRDRARVIKNFLSNSAKFHDMEKVLEFKLLAEYVYGREAKLSYSEPQSYQFYLPGSLSQIVLHAAPGYEPLPEPCSLIDDETVSDSESNESDDESDGENTSDYSYDGALLPSNGNEESGPLIHLDGPEEINASDFGELMSKRSLESWLNETPGPSQSSSDMGHVQRSLARISIKDIANLVKPKSYTLIDQANGNRLTVDYKFSSEVSMVSRELACLLVSFRNYSAEAMSNIFISDEEFMKGPYSSNQSDSASESETPALVPMDEIVSLEPGQTTTRTLQVRFKHHLLPLKLVLWCNGEKQPVKLRPDIGFFIKPLPMDMEAFSLKESQLPGMFEYIKRCTFTDHVGQLNDQNDPSLAKDKVLTICEKLALKMLSNANLFLVAVDMPVASSLDDLSGLCLKLSGEILSNSIPLLITLKIKGTCSEPLEVSVKINCEETVFGLNLLNRIVNFLAD